MIYTNALMPLVLFDQHIALRHLQTYLLLPSCCRWWLALVCLRPWLNFHSCVSIFCLALHPLHPILCWADQVHWRSFWVVDRSLLYCKNITVEILKETYKKRNSLACLWNASSYSTETQFSVSPDDKLFVFEGCKRCTSELQMQRLLRLSRRVNKTNTWNIIQAELMQAMMFCWLSHYCLACLA